MAKKKTKHGKYVYETSKGLFIFDTRMKRGRALVSGKRPIDLYYPQHREIILKIIEKGTRTPNISRKENWN